LLTAVAASYGRVHRAFEWVGVVSAYSLVALLLVRFGRLVRDAGAEDAAEATGLLGLLLSAAAAGYVAADLLGGLVHWAFDRFGSERTPLFGRSFVRPFRLHHLDPKDITRHDFLETNGNNCLATAPLLAGLLWGPFDLAVGAQLFGVSLLTFVAIFTLATNQFHQWAHEDRPPAVIAWLQDHRLILDRVHHQIHHTFPHESHYCITTGWLNAPLSAIGFWTISERLIERVLGVEAHRDPGPTEPRSRGGAAG
jgi:ubiquitin-conjugating enzyme E2 variant